MGGTELSSLDLETAARLRDDPAFFGLAILGREKYTPGQLRIFEAVRSQGRVAVHSGYSCGKTACVADLSLWWLVTRVPSKVITTAPSGHQINNLVWNEIRESWRRGKLWTMGIPEPKLTPMLRIANDHYAVGIATRHQEVSLQGHHSPAVLVAMDEAADIDPPVWTQAEGVASSTGSKIVAIGNPGPPSGPFFERCRSELWRSVHLDCLDHPNVVSGEDVFPGMVSRSWVEHRKREYGEGSPIYQSKVRGLFPKRGEYSLIELEWVETAMREDAPGEERGWHGAPIIGVDVARYGSCETVIVLLEGSRVTELIHAQGWSVVETANRVMGLKASRGFPDSVPVVVDDDGVGGGVSDILAHRAQAVVRFRGGMPSRDERNYPDQRSEAWCHLARSLEQGDLQLPLDDKLKSQLVAIDYEFTRRGQRRLESKDHMMERGLPSPDRGDSLAMAWWYNAPAPAERKDRPKARKPKKGTSPTGWAARYHDLAGT